jgi:hypothetical protein
MFINGLFIELKAEGVFIIILKTLKMTFSESYMNCIERFDSNERRLLDVLIKHCKWDKNQLLFDSKNIFHFKISLRFCIDELYKTISLIVNLKENIRKNKDNIRIGKFNVFMGMGSPGGKYRGLGGFKTESNIVDELNIELFNKKSEKPFNEMYNKVLFQLNAIKKNNIICFEMKNKQEHQLEYKFHNTIIHKSNRVNRKLMNVKENYITVSKFNTCKEIADITIFFKDLNINSVGLVFMSQNYISVKSSNLITLSNNGIQEYFPIDSIQNNKLLEKGILLLNMFNIEPNHFCEVFNNYKNKDPNTLCKNKTFNKKLTFDKHENCQLERNIINFIRASYAYGNSIIIHRTKDTDTVITSNSLIPKKVLSYESYFGGKSGVSKRVDIIVKCLDTLNEVQKYKINFRNKQGGTYPTHIMCDPIK